MDDFKCQTLDVMTLNWLRGIHCARRGTREHQISMRGGLLLRMYKMCALPEKLGYICLWASQNWVSLHYAPKGVGVATREDGWDGIRRRRVPVTHLLHHHFVV
jgi:hypothetical protein